MNLPHSVAVDAAGNLYISEGNHRIRKVDVSGKITTISSVSGATFSGLYGGDGGAATSANLFWPRAITADPSGVFVRGRVLQLCPGGGPVSPGGLVSFGGQPIVDCDKSRPTLPRVQPETK